MTYLVPTPQQKLPDVRKGALDQLLDRAVSSESQSSVAVMDSSSQAKLATLPITNTELALVETNPTQQLQRVEQHVEFPHEALGPANQGEAEKSQKHGQVSFEESMDRLRTMRETPGAQTIHGVFAHEDKSKRIKVSEEKTNAHGREDRQETQPDVRDAAGSKKNKPVNQVVASSNPKTCKPKAKAKAKAKAKCASNKMTREEREQAKQQILAVVPQKIRQKFSGGCSTCRFWWTH